MRPPDMADFGRDTPANCSQMQGRYFLLKTEVDWLEKKLFAAERERRTSEVTLADLRPELTELRSQLQSCFYIDGLEFNQAIQYYRSQLVDNPEDPRAGPRPDNFIPLIATKALGVRVYVHTPAKLRGGLPFLPAWRRYVTGRLKIKRKVSLTSAFEEVSLSPLNTARPLDQQQIDRGDVFQTLNFKIPPELCRGLQNKIQLQLTVELRQKGGIFRGEDRILAKTAVETTVLFERIPDVKIVELRVEQLASEGHMHLPAVPENSLWDLFGLTERIMPFSSISKSSVLYQTANPVGQDTFIRFEETRFRQSEYAGKESVVFAILPLTGGGGRGDPEARAVAFCQDYRGEKNVAHELGHAIAGLHHPPGVMTKYNYRYPIYKTKYKAGLLGSRTLESGAIGEFGYDVEDNKVYPPERKDVMGVGGWISLYNYQNLIRRLRAEVWRHVCQYEEDDPCL